MNEYVYHGRVLIRRIQLCCFIVRQLQVQRLCWSLLLLARCSRLAALSVFWEGVGG